MRRKFSNFIAFTLFALMLFKVSSFHVYSHQDDTSDEIENCDVCELALENTDSEYSFTEAQIVNTPRTAINTNDQFSLYDLAVSSSFLRFNFFGRPPPNMG